MTGLRQRKHLDIRRDAGFALVAVMFISTLLSVVAFIFTTSVRSTLRSAWTTVEVAKAEASAEAGINLALLDMMTQGARSSSPSGVNPAFACALPAGDTVVVRVRDEAGRVDLNMANEELLAALIAGADVPAGKARALAAAVLDFRDADGDRRPSGAEAEDYVAAGSASGPKNAPFQTTEELGQVIGFDSELAGRLRPHVTIHSEQDGVDPSAASPELLAMLSRGASQTSDSILDLTEEHDTLPAAFRTTSVQRAFNIIAEARTRTGAQFVRETIVTRLQTAPRLRPRRLGELPDATVKLPIRVLLWRRGETLSGGDLRVPEGGKMQPC